MDPNKVILWNFFRSSASWRVRIALNLKGIDFEYKPVDLYKNEQYSEEYTKLNPKQEIPALWIDGNLLVQSIAIIEYLDETRSNGPKLLPKDPVKRAQARALAEIVNSGIQPYQNTNVLNRIVKNHGEEAKNEWIKFYLHKGYKAFEETLKQTSGKYCVGDEVSVADLCMVPQYYTASRFNLDMSAYPIMGRIYNDLCELPAFRKAHAHRQVDTFPELKED